MSHATEREPADAHEDLPEQMPVVLVVEAVHSPGVSYEHLLERAGYTVIVSTGEQAMSVSQKMQPALIILQFDPAVSGLGLVRQLRTQPDTRATPVITIVPFDDGHMREQIVRAGATAIMIEPVKLPMLLRQMRRLLARMGGASHPMPAAPAASVR